MPVLTCRVCKVPWDVDEFHAANDRPYGRQSICKACRKAQAQAPKERERLRQAGRAFIDQLKSRPCMDCGVPLPPYVMDFDHLDPSKKQFNIARYLGGGVSQRLLDELEQCDVVCANCHRIRTHKQRQEGQIQPGRPPLDSSELACC